MQRIADGLFAYRPVVRLALLAVATGAPAAWLGAHHTVRAFVDPAWNRTGGAVALLALGTASGIAAVAAWFVRRAQLRRVARRLREHPIKFANLV
jgi:metal-dependent amidase/aminoacylase/carboxypeptidase family protein